MFGSRVKIDKTLLVQASRYAKAAGYASVDEFVNHVLEKAIASFEQAESEEEIKKRLKGLGYLS